MGRIQTQRKVEDARRRAWTHARGCWRSGDELILIALLGWVFGIDPSVLLGVLNGQTPSSYEASTPRRASPDGKVHKSGGLFLFLSRALYMAASIPARRRRRM